MKMAVVELLNGLRVALRDLERRFLFGIFGGPPPPLCVMPVETPNTVNQSKKNTISLKDIIGNGFLYAVPKHRRSVQKRLKRKFGVPGLFWKPLVPKTNLRTCNECGGHHEPGVLCLNCYERVINETKLMQNKIQENLGLNPIEEEVIVLYDGEKLQEPEEFWKGKRIIEMEKARPPWFSKNLLQKTTQKPSTSTDVKPSELA